MNIARALTIIGALIATAIVAGIAYLLFADLSTFKPDIEAAVSDITGREFKINGDFELDALPSPYVSMTSVTLANADWSDRADMIELGSASVRVGLWSLLFGPIVVHELRVNDLAVHLETNADGEGNWDMFESDDETSSEPASELPVEFRIAEIRNVDLVYRQPDTEDMQVTIEQLDVVVNDAGSRNFSGNGTLLDKPLSIEATRDEDWLEVQASIDDIELESKLQYASGVLSVDATLHTLDRLGVLLGIEDLPTESVTLTGNLAARGESLVISDLVATLADARLTVDGELDGGNSTAALSIAAESSSLDLLADLPDVPFAGNAQVVLEEGKIDVNPFDFSIGESDISGTLQLVGQEQPSLTLEARSEMIDLRPFSAESAEGDSEPAPPAEGEPEPAPSAEDEETTSNRYVFKEEPLPMDTLRSFQADIDVAVDRIQMPTTHVEEVKIVAAANDGVLTLDNSFRGGRGGEYENHIELNASGSNAQLALKTLATDLKLGLFSGEEIPAELVPVADFEMDVSANGVSPRQLASSLNGKMLLTQGPGRVRNDLIGGLSGDLIAQIFGALNPFAKEEEFSNWDCTIFSIDFESGEGDISAFLLQGEKIMVVGGGEIDLNTEKLNIEFNTKPREGVGVSADMFVTPFVAVSGTLAEPGVGLNKKGVILSGGAAVLTGGLSFLYKGFLDRATAGADQCEETLATVTGAGVPAEK